jgi:hypothetical protein
MYPGFVDASVNGSGRRFFLEIGLKIDYRHIISSSDMVKYKYPIVPSN